MRDSQTQSRKASAELACGLEKPSLAVYGNIPTSKTLLNENALPLLRHDDPEKRRRVYLELQGSDPQALLAELAQAGFDMNTLCSLEDPSLSVKATRPELHCLIMGTANAILTLLQSSAHLVLARVDLPEYTWLSSCKPVIAAPTRQPLGAAW